MTDNILTETAVSRAKKFEDEDETSSFYDIEYMDAQVRANINGDMKSVRALLDYGGPNVWIETNGRSLTVLAAQGSDSHKVPVFDREDIMEEMWNHFARRWKKANPDA